MNTTYAIRCGGESVRPNSPPGNLLAQLAGGHVDRNFVVTWLDRHHERLLNHLARFVPDLELMLPGRQVLDFKRPVRRGDRSKRMLERQMIGRHYLWGMNPWSKDWFENGYMIKADSIEELAQKCGINTGKLQASIGRFNGFCQTGVDADKNGLEKLSQKNKRV